MTTRSRDRVTNPSLLAIMLLAGLLAGCGVTPVADQPADDGDLFKQMASWSGPRSMFSPLDEPVFKFSQTRPDVVGSCKEKNENSDASYWFSLVQTDTG